jgi:hypothetical protein
MINNRSHLLELQIRILLSRTAGISQNTLDAVINGIANQRIKSIGVYGVDDKNRCRVILELEINWSKQTCHVMVLGDRGVLAETVLTRDDPLPEVGTVISAFTQIVEADHLRTEWYCRYEHGLELPELKLPFSGVSPANVPTEYPQALLQHRYALDILTQSSHKSDRILPIPVMKEGEVANHVKQLQQEGHWGEGKPPQGIIYQRGNLSENYERHAKQLVEALGDEQHSLRQPAEQALKGFVVAVEKPQVRERRAMEGQEDKGAAELITLKEAVEAHGVPYETLRSWLRSGYLSVKGRETFGTHGGGKILVDNNDINRLKSKPPTRGRPPTNTAT